MDLTHREAVLIVTALAGLSYDFEQADPELADEAWALAQDIAEQHGIDPADAMHLRQ